MNTYKYILILLITTFVATSCNKWLDVLPENDQISSEYWKTKENVESVLAAGYVKLRSSIDQLFVWGEARGNGIEFSNLIDDNAKSAQKLRALDILPNNYYAEWGNLYKIINMANSVIKYSPEVAENDPSFNINIMNSYNAEAYFLRSLSYYYLVRTFGEVPFVTEPYVNDETSYSMAKTDGKTILNHLVADLEKALPSAKEFFPEEDPFNPMNSKGRATKWAIHALLADINLWLGNYDNAITSCDAILNSGRVGLISRELWFTNFFPGNSNESIFEIQYSYEKGQTNSNFLKWFNTERRYTASEYTVELYYQNLLDQRNDSAGDIRSENSSFNLSASGFLIWKYIGRDNDMLNPQPRTATGENDQNFIIYRLADIYLMKAEAYIMKGSFTEAEALIKKIRDRAGIISPMPGMSDESTALNVLLEERHREFFAEGKNWFDILRIAQRDDFDYKDKLIDQALILADSKNQAIMRSKLADVNSYYLPIHTAELINNTLLVQNPYYVNIGQ